MYYAVPFLISFSSSLVFTFIVKKIALANNITDKPTAKRKIHKKPVPLLGGVSLFISFFVSAGVLFFLGYFTRGDIPPALILSLFIGALIIIVGGVIDDAVSLPPKFQIIFPIVSILPLLIAGVRVIFVTNPFGGVIEVNSLFSVVITFGWLLGMMYTTKLLDGLDGLLTGVGFIGSLIIFIVSLFWNQPFSSTSVLSIIFSGILLGFLFFNFHPAKIFLGEGGSLFVGYMLGLLSIISGSKIATTLLIMGLPIIDVFWVIFRRFQSNISITTSGTDHFHFQLLKRGMSHRTAVVFLYSIALFFGMLSLFLKTPGKIIALFLLLITAIFLLFWYYPKNREKQ